MDKYLTRFIFLISALLIVLTCFNCDNNHPEIKEADNYKSSILRERAEKDSSLQFDMHSPFQRDTSITFKPLNYFAPNSEYVFNSKLYNLEKPDTVTIMGTKGEPRMVIVIGYIELMKNDHVYKVNIYKGFSRTGEAYYSIWFTDKTTGKETYGVGRYLDFELNSDSNYTYTIDFNKAYNPYCAYTPIYTCPIPRVEDYIDMTIEAGEKNFH